MKQWSGVFTDPGPPGWHAVAQSVASVGPGKACLEAAAAEASGGAGDIAERGAATLPHDDP